MRQLLRLLLLNHAVVSRGKLVACMSVSECRSGAYWI